MNEISGKKEPVYNADLVDLAYSMAVEPERLGKLTHLLLSNMGGGTDSDNDHNLDQIALHFQRALDLMERRGRRFDYATGSMRFTDMDKRAAVLVNKDGEIFHANPASVRVLGLKDGSPFPEKLFMSGEYRRFRNALKTIAREQVDKVVKVFNITHPETGESLKVALSRVTDYKGRAIGRLSTFHVTWNSDQGRQFKQAFGLTRAELDIVQSVIIGQALADLATEKGRAITTLRSQTKGLLKKLGVHSRVELACLYSGFIHFNRGMDKPAALPMPEDEYWREAGSVKLTDDRMLQYELVGPEKGRPVLFFHGLSGGNVLTKKMRAEIRRYNIRLIMVWRPFFAGSTPDTCKAKHWAKSFARDVEQLLDHLGVQTCQIISYVEGAVHTYACVQRMPERILGLVNCGGAIPIVTNKQLQLIHPMPRSTLLVAKHAPLLLPLLMRSFLSKVDAGFDLEFAMEYYGTDSTDYDAYMDSELRGLVRKAYPIFTSQGYMGYVKTVQSLIHDWRGLLDGWCNPVDLVHGTHDTGFAWETVRDFANQHDHITLHTVERGGQMIWYSHPELVFEVLDSQFSRLRRHLS